MLFDKTPITFPRLFSPPIPGVQSPFTCRHPKHLRCACYGQPSDSAASAPRAKSSPAEKQPDTAVAALRRAYAEALHQLKRYYMDLLTEIVEVVRGFPDAAAAVEAQLRSNSDDDPTYPEFAL